MRGVWRFQQWRQRQRLKRLARQSEAAVAAFPRLTSRRPNPLDAPLIVTLTSYPPRFGVLHKTLASLLDQTVRADRTVLWIAEQDLAALPLAVRAMEAHGLEIRACRDLRSFKKLVPALQQWPGSYFVTADDDVYYPPHWLESLVVESQANPGCVVAGRVHLARTSTDGLLEPYGQWELATSHRSAIDATTRLFPTGVGGVLYPPGAFVDEVLDDRLFSALCPHGDDIWFFWMSRLAGTDQRRARNWFDIISWPQSQDVALCNDNLFNDRNDVQIRAIQEHYGPVR